MPGSHEVARRELAAFNARDIEAQVGTFGPGAEFRTPGASGRRPADFSHSWWQAFPDARMSCDRAVAEGSVAVIEGTFTGTHVGTLHLEAGDIPPTGQRVAMPWVAVYEVRDGLIVSKHVYFDQLTLLRQLGAALPAAKL